LGLLVAAETFRGAPFVLSVRAAAVLEALGEVSDRTIRQGEVYWIAAEALRPSVPGAPHPHVVIQTDLLNQSRIPTTVVCAISSNAKRAEGAGNVALEAGEANLPRRSVVVVSRVSTVEKADLGDFIGTLSQPRIEQILDGLGFVQRTYFER
jgi:mRNA interferase MazF